MNEIVILPLDIPTLALGRGIVQVMLGGLLLFLGSRHEQALGARWWAAGFLLNGLSLAVFAVQVPPSWETPTTLINHLSLAASSICLLLGFWSFGGQPARRWVLAILIGAPLLALLLWEFLLPNARYRVLAAAATQAFFLACLFAHLGTAQRPEISLIYRRLRYVVIAYLIVFVWSYGSIVGLLPTTARLSPDYHRTLFSVSSLLFMLALAVGCLALQFALLAARSADLAMLDWLTGLPNRRGFFAAVQSRGLFDPAADRALSVIALDIDRFKAINDRHGHAAGDRVLQDLAQALRSVTGPGDLLARMGGEEFLVVLPGVGEAIALACGERIRKAVLNSAPRAETGLHLSYTVSVGLAVQQPGETLAQTVLRADDALYRAKREGRDRVVLDSASAAPDVAPEVGSSMSGRPADAERAGLV